MADTKNDSPLTPEGERQEQEREQQDAADRMRNRFSTNRDPASTNFEKKRLEPGQKQPAHTLANERAQQTLDKLSELRQDIATETMEPSWKRAEQSGNPNKTPPHERVAPIGPAQSAAADLAASHLAAAESAIVAHETAEERIKSDPRYERDQKVYEMAVTGKIGLVPPSDAEAAAMAERSGLSPEVAELVPKTPEEQVADDMQRLKEAEDRARKTGIGAGAASRRTDEPDQNFAGQGDPTAKGPGGPGSDVNAIRRQSASDEPRLVSSSTPTPIRSEENTISRVPSPASPSGSTGTGAVTRPSVIRPGDQENAPRNNLMTDAAGKTVGGAEGERIDNEDKDRIAKASEASAAGTVIK